MNTIIEIIKKIMEYSTYQVITSFVFTVLTYVILGEKMLVIKDYENIGIVISIIFVFAVWFLITGLITVTYKKYKKIVNSNEKTKESNKEREQLNNRILEELRSQFDEMENLEQDLVMSLLGNENESLLTPNIKDTTIGGAGVYYSRLVQSEWLYISKYHGKEETTGPIKLRAEFGRESNTIMSRCKAKNKVKLKENVYNALRYSLKEYGRISHCD